MPNAVCVIIVEMLKKSVAEPVVVDSNTFLSCIWKCCVMYLTKNALPLLGMLVKMCRPCGFSKGSMCIFHQECFDGVSNKRSWM
jgi:hypothetical protein